MSYPMLDEQSRTWLSKPTCSVAQAATLLGLSENSVYEAARTGDLKTVRIGKRIVVPTAPLRKMLMLDEPAAPSASAA